MNSNANALMKKETYDFADLRTVMEILRAEEGCPWDREQDHHSIRSCLIEETYEVVEAIDTENPTLLREELGDLLFQIMFHSRIEEEKGSFSVEEVVDEITKKMITRHPHVFGDVNAETSAEVLKNWDAIKTEEKQRLTLGDKLRAIPPMLPSLMRAAKVVKKGGVTENTDAGQVVAELKEVLATLPTNVKNGQVATSLGSILMLVSELCVLYGVDGEEELQKQTDSIIEKIEKNA